MALKDWTYGDFSLCGLFGQPFSHGRYKEPLEGFWEGLETTSDTWVHWDSMCGWKAL